MSRFFRKFNEDEEDENEEDSGEERDPKEDARAILLDLKNRLSLAEIKEKYKDIYGDEPDEDEKEDDTLFKYENDLKTEFPIVPGLSIGIGLEAAILLDKFINKPDFSQKGNPMELSAGLLGSCSLSLRVSLDTGVHYLFSIGGGITGALIAEGTGDNKELIQGSAFASMGIEKDQATEKYHFILSEPPMIQFTAGIQLTGSVGADITASSKVFGWSKSLYEIEFGSWEIARVTGVAELQKKDNDFYHMFQNWELSQASINVAVLGNEIYEKSLKSKYGLKTVKELVQNREAYNKSQYGILLEKLQQFLSHSGQQVLIGTGLEGGGLQSMVQQAMDLKKEAMLQLDLEHTALQVNINETDRLLVDKGQRKEREDSRKAMEKHQVRLQKLEENPQKAEATRGYRNARMEELQKEHLFGSGSRQALAFYQMKQQEEAQKDILNTDEAFQKALQAGIADPQFIRDFLEKKLKLSRWEIIAHYATLDDIQKYEEVRKKSYLDAAMQKDKKKTPEATLKSLIKKGDYSWVRVGGVGKILAYEQAAAQREASSNQKEVQEIDAEGLTENMGKNRLLANSRQELIDTYREILQPNAQDLEQQYGKVLESLTKTQGGEPARFSSTIRDCLTLEMLVNYEQLRLTQVSRKEKTKHQQRIERLNSYIAERNSHQNAGNEDEAQAAEKAGIDWYLGEADRMMNKLRRNQVTVPGLKYAVVAHEAEERMEDEWIRKLRTATEGDAAALLDLQLPPEAEAQIGAALYEKRRKEQEEGAVNLSGYNQAKKLELFRGKKSHSHTECYQELCRYWEDHGKENVNPDFFVQKYLSLGGGAGYAPQV